MFRELKEEPLSELRRERRNWRLLHNILRKALLAILAGILVGLVILTVTEPYEAVAKTVSSQMEADEMEIAAEKLQIEYTVPATEEEMTGPAYDMPTEAETKEETTAVDPEENRELLGIFTVTAYCSCRKCCGKWSGGPTASGVMPQSGRTIAVDKCVIALGTRVYIEGYGEFVAEDTGSDISGNRIDIYMDSHEAARLFGSCKKEVWIIK